MLSEANGNEPKTTEQKVAWILEKVPAARSNYLMLLLVYWIVYDNVELPVEIVEQVLGKATKPETITRARRKIFEMKKQLKNVEKEIDALWEGKKS